jgi:hypothetical protein
VPYFIYRVRPFGQLDPLGEHDAFAAASLEAKAMRSALPAGSPDRVKLVFAENAWQAEDLLCQVREPGPAGDD